MKTLDTLVVIEPPAHSTIDSDVVTNSTEELPTSSTSPETNQEKALVEPQQPISDSKQETVEQPEFSDTQPESLMVADNVETQAAVETSSKENQESVLQLSEEQHAEAGQLFVEKDTTPVLVSVPDNNDSPIMVSDTDTSTLQTFTPETTEHSMMPFAFEWIAVGVVLITALILLISNRKTTKRLEKLSEAKTIHQHISNVDIEFEKAKIIAENRQQWIHTLREEIANFVSATNAIWDLHKIKDGCEDILTDMKDPQFVMKELYHWSCKYNQAMQETEKLYAKIHLLINPQEETTQQLSSLLDKAMVAVEAKKSPSKLNDEIIEISQRILKDEWVRVKGFE